MALKPAATVIPVQSPWRLPANLYQVKGEMFFCLSLQLFPGKEACSTCEAVGCLLQGWQRGSFKDRSSVLNRRDKTSSLGYSDRRQQQTRFVIFWVVFSASLSFTSCYTHGSLDWVLDDGILFDFIFLTLCVGVERREPEAWNGGGKAGGEVQ